MIVAGRGSIFDDNHIQSDLKAMIIAGMGEIFNDNAIQSHIKAMIVVRRGRFSTIILSRVI